MRIIFIFFFFTCFGCKTVHNSQTQNLQAFASSAKNLSDAPGELYRNISDFRHELKLVESSTLFSTDRVVVQLNQAVALKKAFEKNAEKVDEACHLIGTYADCLLSLVEKDYHKELDKQSAELSYQLTTALDGFNQMFNKKIPVNAGNLLGMIVNEIGSIKLKQLQKRYLKEFVRSGSFIIDGVCDYFTHDMANHLDLEMAVLDSDFDNVMRKFFNGIEQYQRTLQNVNPFDYLKNYNPIYLEMKENLEGLHTLKVQTVTAMQKIQLAHSKLEVAVESDSSKEMLQEIKDLFSVMRDIKIGHSKLNQKSKPANHK